MGGSEGVNKHTPGGDAHADSPQLDDFLGIVRGRQRGVAVGTGCSLRELNIILWPEKRNIRIGTNW